MGPDYTGENPEEKRFFRAGADLGLTTGPSASPFRHDR